MTNFKKSLVLGALIAAFAVPTAFAAEATDTDNPHRMRDRVAQIRTEERGETPHREGMAWREKCPGRTVDCANGTCDHYKNHQRHNRPELTPEERQARQEQRAERRARHHEERPANCADGQYAGHHRPHRPADCPNN